MNFGVRIFLNDLKLMPSWYCMIVHGPAVAEAQNFIIEGNIGLK